MKKIIALIGIICLFGLMFVPLVSASYVCPAAHDATPGINASLRVLHPSSTTQVSATGVCFQANATAYLYNVTVPMYRYGSPTGSVTANLYSIVGTFGVDALPATLIETSIPINVTDLQGSYLDTTFEFNQTTQLTSSSYYFIQIEVSETTNTWDGFNNVNVGVTSGYAGNGAHYHNSAWSTLLSSYELIFTVNGDSTEGTPPATPTPTPGPTSSTGDADIEELTAIILPWLVPLLVCLIPALLGYKFVGELGFFIGLNVGCILAYVTLASTAYAFPLWGIILVGVMDVAVVLMRR